MSHIDVRESLLVVSRSWILSKSQFACHSQQNIFCYCFEFFVKLKQGLASVYCIISKLSPTNSKFWCFRCISCNPDIFKVEVCTVGTSAVMYLLPHDIDTKNLRKLHGKTYIRELYFTPFASCICSMSTMGAVNLVAAIIATVNQ